jgi:DNA segregation ATPase FtsK/SpoIIIE, S-DNA-T family
MSAIDRTLDSLTFLTEEARDALRRRLRELGGAALILLALMLAIALATWSVRDPSLSHATTTPVRNLLGVVGSTVADLSMQIFGLAALALILPIALWGWRLTSHRPLARERIRLAIWVFAVALVAAFAACLPRPTSWPLPVGLGGVVGDAVLRGAAWLMGGTLGSFAYIVIGATSAVLGFVALAITCGFALHGTADELDADEDEPEEDPQADEHQPEQAATAESDEKESRAAISLGFLVHGFLSLKARLARLFSRGDGDSSRRLALSGRSEPSFDESSNEEELDEEEEAPEPPKKKAKPSRRSGGYVLPSLDLLAAARSNGRPQVSAETLQNNSAALEGVLGDFGVRGEIINARPGPVVTLYELEPAPGIKSSRVIALADDIARSMSALSARVAVVPGRNAIGIELPNPHREKVLLRELLASEASTGSNAKLPLCLGKTIGGEPVIVDLARMPHLLIAGTTGSGKSVAINTMILSLLYTLKPEQCRLIMVDPKMLELSVYDNIPHLLTPVVTDPKKAVVALKWAVREMEERYKKMSKLGVRNIDGYNARIAEAVSKGEKLTRTVHTGYDKESGDAIYEEEELDLEPLPYVVVIVDEMADLMMVAGKDIEGAVQRLAQMARAAGLHVILATQRPSVDVITGTIKANFPTRISFQVTSKIDSRTILGEQGAEQLLGQGDMLYMQGGGRISRVHGPFVSDDEVEKVVRHLKSQGQPQYLEAVTAADEPELDEDGNPVFDATGMGQSGDPSDLYQQAVQIVLRDRKASTSYIQRRLQIGYNRAASLMERMEQEGVVGQANHAGKREILIGGENE